MIPKLMRIAVCDQPGSIQVLSRPVPLVQRSQVLVKVRCCGVCSSDLAVWRGRLHKKYPYSPGHEFCGTIAQADPSVSKLGEGQRVVINPNLSCGECRYCRAGKPNLCDSLKSRNIKSNGGFSEYVALDQRMVVPLPDSLPDALAVFVEPLSCAVHAVRRLEVRPGENIAIFGAGIMGILTGLALGSCGAAAGFVEPLEIRRQPIVTLFDTEAISPENLRTADKERVFDGVVDCSGNAAAVGQAIRVLRKGGRLVLLGLAPDSGKDSLPLADVTTKELEIRGAWLNPGTFEQAVALANSMTDLLRLLRTETFRLEDIVLAFERASSPEVHKVIVGCATPG